MSALSLNATLLAHEAPDFTTIQDAWHKREPDQGACCHKFVILGRFDQLILTLADDPAALFPIGSGVVTNARAATSSSYIGRVVAPDSFNPSEWAERHPVVGLCSVRFARRILAAAGNFDFLDHFLTARLDGARVRHAVVSATGWEDALVLFFSTDFNMISHAAGILRSMRLADLPFADQINAEDGFTHACLTTCTLPAFCCPWSSSWKIDDTDSLLARINATAPLNWAVRIELHPGHWDAFAAELIKRSEAIGIAVAFRPAFGQTDLRISDAGGTSSTHGGLLRFLLHVISPLGAEPGTVMRSAETHLHPVLKDYGEDATAGPMVDQNARHSDDREAAFPEEIRRKLDEAAIPPHTLRVLEETLSRVQGISRDPMHGEEFETLQRLRDAFITAVRAMKPEITETESRQLQLDVSEWQMLLDRCLADRFRGPYPAGDSLMMRLGTYQGAHHRFLVVMDTLAQRAYNLARDAISGADASCLLPDAALATFIGNSPSAYATAHTIDWLGCGFTDVPASLVCRMRDAHLLLHETGHHVIRAFFASLPNLGFDPYDHDHVYGLGPKAHARLIESGLQQDELNDLDEYWKKPGVKREVRELLSDFFASCICFPGNLTAHRKAALHTLANFYDGGSKAYLRSVQTEFYLRSGGIDALQKNRLGAVEDYTTFVRRGQASIGSESNVGINLSRFDERATVIRKAVHAIQLLSKLPEIKALLDGFEECARLTNFQGEDAGQSLLEDLREFLASPDSPSMDGSFKILDNLWFKLLRRREKRHIKESHLATMEG